MSRINRDCVVATVLLIATGVLFWDTLQWRHAPYATMPSSVWPRIVLVVFGVLCAIYFVRSLRMRDDDGAPKPALGTLTSWLVYYRNPLWCYLLFFVFLVAMPYLGMLVGGILFVWGVQAMLGERSPSAQLRHAAIAVGSVGFMWLVFTYALHVILPPGTLVHI